MDAFYTYDEMERVVLDCKVSGSCATADIKSEIAFNTAGDRNKHPA